MGEVKEKSKIIERCGYCGQYIVNGVDIGSPNGFLSNKEINNYTLGYCSNAQQEHCEQFPEDCEQFPEDCN